MTTVFRIEHLCLHIPNARPDLAFLLLAWTVLSDPNILPFFQVVAKIVPEFIQRREELNLGSNERSNNKLYEAYLGVRLVHLVPVIQHLHWKAHHLLLVALSKELIKHEIRPELTDLPLLAWI